MLDSVSRAYSMGLLSIVHSAVRSVIFSERNAQISFEFSLLPPLGHTLRRFVNLKKKIELFTNIFRFR